MTPHTGHTRAVVVAAVVVVAIVVVAKVCAKVSMHTDMKKKSLKNAETVNYILYACHMLRVCKQINVT